MSTIDKKYVDYTGLGQYDSALKEWVDNEISTSLTDFEGATSSTDGVAGQVPAPSAGDDEKFLRGDGTWSTIVVSGSVTGVKGDSESEYRDGNVNITKSNIGLGNVENTKAVSVEASQGLSSTEQANARANIGLGTAAEKSVPSSGDAGSNEVVLGSDSRLSDSRPASDVYEWAKASAKPTYTASEVGAIASTEKGSANGVAELDENGLIPSSQLPSYVDDIVEGYYNSTDGKFYEESTFETEIPGESGKIYVSLTNANPIPFRWSGSAFVEIPWGLVLGETSSTAYRGDRGKTAYDHSQLTSGNPHGVTKTDVGLGNVGNFKAVSTVASQGLTDTEKSNARTNIGVTLENLGIFYGDTTTWSNTSTANKAKYKIVILTND